MNYTITRYEGSKVWDCAIRPDSGAFIIFVDNEERPYVYKRIGNVTDDAGDVRERYAYAPVSDPEGVTTDPLRDPAVAALAL